MKRDWEEMLDQLEEKDLAEYLPETLPEVDEVTQKRTETIQPETDCGSDHLSCGSVGRCGQRTDSGGF